MHFRSVRLPNEPAGSRFLTTDGQHGFSIRPSVWLVPLVLPPYLDASEGFGLPETGLLDYWSW